MVQLVDINGSTPGIFKSRFGPDRPFGNEL
jgi:hypothetical protein